MCVYNQALNIIFPRVVFHGRSLMDCEFKVTNRETFQHVTPDSLAGGISSVLFLRVLCVLRGEFVISTVVEKSLSVYMLTCMTERCFDYAQHDKKLCDLNGWLFLLSFVYLKCKVQPCSNGLNTCGGISGVNRI